MKKMSLLVLLFFFSIFNLSYAQTRGTEYPHRSLKEIQNLSDSELTREIDLLAGQKDLWKSNFKFWALVKNIQFAIPWRAKPNLTEPDFKSFVNVVSNPYVEQGLQNGFLLAWKSSSPELKSLAVVIVGEKRAYANSYFDNHKRSDLESTLFFLANLKRGETYYELSRFEIFVASFNWISLSLDRAAQIALQHNMPVLLELQTSALDPYRSPIMYAFAQKAIAASSKQGNTPNGGKILALHPRVAYELAQELKEIKERMTRALSDFKRRKRTEDTSIAAKDLINMIRTGQGVVSNIDVTCSELFQ